MLKLRMYQALVLIFVTVPLLCTIYAVVLLWNRYVFWSDIAIFFLMYTVTSLGVTIGYHRMLTHKSFECSEALRTVFLILGAMGFMMQPSNWAAKHTKHHAHSDQEGDPHSPLEGFWHAHFGWILFPKLTSEVEKYAPHLLKDPVVRFVDRTTYLWMGLSLLIPFALGGWTGLLWGGGVRIFMTSHTTWSVNSVCHTFGRKSFETTDQSRNNWLVGLLAFGEGWHNNHHAFPRNAFHGMRWWQVDCSGLIIRGLERLGLVWNVQRVSLEVEDAHRTRMEDMRLVVADLHQKLITSISNAKYDVSALYSALPEMSKEKQKRMKALKKKYMKRLRKIDAFASTPSYMRKNTIGQYMDEVRDLVAEAKDVARRELQLARG